MASGDKADPFSAATAQLTFHNFLEKMRHPSAVDLVRSIKGFIVSFQASPPDPDKDSAAVQQFLAQTEASFRAHPLWAGATEEELESAGEGLEKYLLTKVFARAFGPLPADAATDRLLAERMAALQQFLRPEHLDIPASFGNEPSWLLAQKELGKLGAYKAPRDKLVCILNCCRVINNLLLNMAMAAQGDPPGADDFLPVLIYIVIKANPPALHSNLQFIQRYRAASRLVAESAYFFTNAVSAASFIEHLNPSSLTIDPAEFESKMQQALTHIPPNLPDATPPPARKVSTPPGKAGDLPPRHNRSHSEGENGSQLEAPPAGLSTSGSSPSLALADAVAGARMPMPPPSPGLTVSPADSASAPLTQPGDALAQLEARGAAAVVGAAESGQLARDYRFLYTSVGDLRVGDVEALLTEYKELVLKYESLARGLQERNAGLARQLDVTSRHTGGGRADARQKESEADTEGGEARSTESERAKGGDSLEALDGMPRGSASTADQGEGQAGAPDEKKEGDGMGSKLAEQLNERITPGGSHEHVSDAGRESGLSSEGKLSGDKGPEKSELGIQNGVQNLPEQGDGHDVGKTEVDEVRGTGAEGEATVADSVEDRALHTGGQEGHREEKRAPAENGNAEGHSDHSPEGATESTDSTASTKLTEGVKETAVEGPAGGEEVGERS